MNKKETIIISLGGSLVVPDDIDLIFLKKFKNILSKYLKKQKFFIIVGGGKNARKYQRVISEFGAKSQDMDWIGIDITRLNAKIIKQMFFKNSYPEIIIDPNKKIKTNKNIIVGAGWKPGWSTDYDSVLIAKNHNVKTIINLTNIDYVYDKDPSKFSEAEPIREINWVKFNSIVGRKWSPGMSAPFDPKASKLAAKLKLKVAMINGTHLERLENFLNNKTFIGTIIQ